MMNRWLELSLRPLRDGSGNMIIEIADEVLEHADELTEDLEIREMSLVGARGKVTQLLKIPIFSNLRAITLSKIDDADAQVLSAADLPALRKLDMHDGFLHADGMQALGRAAWLPQLEQLLVYGHRELDDEAVTMFCEHAMLPNLTELNLRDSNLREKGAASLASLSLPGLRKLDLGNWYDSWVPPKILWNFIGPEGAKAIAGARWCRQLEELDLSHNSIEDDGAEALVRALDMPKHLNLQYNHIGPRSAAALAATPWGRNARLGISHNKLFHETDTFDTYDYGMVPRELTYDELKQRYGFRNIY